MPSCPLLVSANPQTDWGYGVVVSVLRRPGDAAYTCDTLLACDPDSLKVGPPRPASTGMGWNALPGQISHCSVSPHALPQSRELRQKCSLFLLVSVFFANSLRSESASLRWGIRPVGYSWAPTPPHMFTQCSSVHNHHLYGVTPLLSSPLPPS